MTILDPIISDFLGIPYPDEETNPFYDQFKGMVLAMEQIMLYSKMFSGMFLGGGGNRAWSVGSSGFTWTADFNIAVPMWGFKIIVPYGPDNATRVATIQDGQFIYVDVPVALSENVTVNFKIGSQISPKEHNHFVCAMRVGGKLYVRNIGEMS